MDSTFLKKQAVLFLMFLFFISFDSLAQNRIGLMTGGGYCKENINLIGTNGIPAFEFKVSYYLRSEDFIYFRINLGYKQRGNKVLYPVNPEPSNSGFLLYHIPFIGPDIIINPELFKKRFYLFTGFSADYFMDYSKSKEFDNELAVNITDMYSKLQYSANSGLGFKINSSWFAEFCFSTSFINKVKIKQNPGPKAYDRYFGLGVGYIL
ncbi:MAG: hypothetical protein R6W78_01685 [Bacteroidales bacterium]